MSASLLAVACGDNTIEGGDAPLSVHEQATRAPHELPRLPSKLLVNVPRAYPLARTKAGMLRLGGSSGPQAAGTSELVTTGRTIVQKTLLLAATGQEPAFLAAQSSLDRIGVPYQAVIATQQALTADMLTDSVSTCYFSSVILTTDSLGYDNGGTWTSALTADQWQLLADFEAACSAREAIWYAYPNPSLGLNWPTGSWDWTTPVDATITAPSFFAGVRSTAKVPVRYAAGYDTTIADASTTSLLEDVSGNVMMALHTFADGRQALVSTFDQSPYLVHSLLLEYDLVRWVTGGMFLGKKRAYLTAQVDDVLIDDDMWIAGVGNDGSVQFRITGTDISSLATWQNSFRASLPSGSSFSAVFAFNGAGSLTSNYSDTTLLNQALKYNKSFLWLSHTWDHENMDAMIESDAYSEAQKNIKLANKDKLSGFSKTELVTPDVSGLTNLAALEGIYSAGVRYVVSNTSIDSGKNPSFNVGIANALEPRIYEVPRHPTNVFYDVATPDNEADEYNHYYAATLGTLTYDQVIDHDTDIAVMYLFQGDVDPLMFHQPNLANYNAGTGLPPASLYGDWLTAVTQKFTSLTPAPLKTLQERDIGAAMQQRGAYDACGLTAEIVESSTGSRSLQLAATNACVVPVTGLSASSAGSVETYLGSPTTSITMSAGSVKSISLP